MISDDVAAFLIAQGVGTSSNIFAGQIPESLDSGVGVFEYQGPPDKIVQIEFPMFEVQVRDTSKYAAYVMAHNIYVTLNRQTDITMNGVNYKRVEASTSPMFWGKDEKQRFQFIINFNTIKTEEGILYTGPICNTNVYCNTNIYCGG
jgi:hypothetical protein